MTSSHRVPAPVALAGVKQIIAIGSGKGGVGKSTVAALLAFAAAHTNLSVGFLDADIYGPSARLLFGDTAHSFVNDQKKIIPAVLGNLKIVSMAYLIPADKPVIWRGALAMGAMRQMLFDAEWGELDILFIDLPPGTGDVVLTLAQSVIVDGAILVTTPQDLAWADARRAAQLFQKLAIPILGVIENMSYFECDSCHTRSDIFGHSANEFMFKNNDLGILAKIPLTKTLREAGDASRLDVYLGKEPALIDDISKILKRIAHIADI